MVFSAVVLRCLASGRRETFLYSPFFAAGSVWAAVAALLGLVFVIDAARDSATTLPALRAAALTFVELNGFVLMFILAVSMRTFPIFFERRPARPQPTLAAWALANAGIAAYAAAFIWKSYDHSADVRVLQTAGFLAVGRGAPGAAGPAAHLRRQAGAAAGIGQAQHAVRSLGVPVAAHRRRARGVLLRPRVCRRAAADALRDGRRAPLRGAGVRDDDDRRDGAAGRAAAGDEAGPDAAGPVRRAGAAGAAAWGDGGPRSRIAAGQRAAAGGGLLDDDRQAAWPPSWRWPCSPSTCSGRRGRRRSRWRSAPPRPASYRGKELVL